MSKEVTNLTERKNPHTPVYGVCLSVCQLQTFEPNYLRTGKTEWAKKKLGHLWQLDSVFRVKSNFQHKN